MPIDDAVPGEIIEADWGDQVAAAIAALEAAIAALEAVDLTAPQLAWVAAAISGRVAFPSTANPSADANTLDDYEEAAWTPGVSFNNLSVGVTYHANNVGVSIRIGRLVLVQGRLRLTAKGSSTGAARITGLPVNPALQASVAFGYVAGMSGLTGALMGRTESGAIVLVQSAATGNAGVSDTNFTAASDLMFSAVYDAGP